MAKARRKLWKSWLRIRVAFGLPSLDRQLRAGGDVVEVGASSEGSTHGIIAPMQTLAFRIVVVIVALTGCSKGGERGPSASDSGAAGQTQPTPLPSARASASATSTSAGIRAAQVSRHDDTPSPCGNDMYGLSQKGMTECAARKANLAEKEMDATLQLLEQRRASEVALVKAIKRAQAEWLKFRAAEIDALFPEEEKQVAYGSMYNVCHARQRERLAKLRTAELRLWLDGDPEAQDCFGAVSAPARASEHH